MNLAYTRYNGAGQGTFSRPAPWLASSKPESRALFLGLYIYKYKRGVTFCVTPLK